MRRLRLCRFVYFTFNVGGGVMGFFTSHLGVRGDLRYYRAFGFKLADLDSAGLKLDRFDFWRGNIRTGGEILNRQ